jgi:large subunit ribosomal protein L4
MKLDVVNIQGEKTGRSVDLPVSVFETEPNEHAVYLAVKQYLGNQRQGTHSAKERNAVAGSTRKIKRQKGTGTARAGDIKNPLFRGGGRVFGPRPRKYKIKLNKKVKNLARNSALAQKAIDNKIVLLEDFTFDEPATASYKEILSALEANGKRSLLVLGEYDKNILASTRNIQGAEVMHAKDLNTYDIMKANTLIISESGLNVINEMFA